MYLKHMDMDPKSLHNNNLNPPNKTRSVEFGLGSHSSWLLRICPTDLYHLSHYWTQTLEKQLYIIRSRHTANMIPPLPFIGQRYMNLSMMQIHLSDSSPKKELYAKALYTKAKCIYQQSTAVFTTCMISEITDHIIVLVLRQSVISHVSALFSCTGHPAKDLTHWVQFSRAPFSNPNCLQVSGAKGWTSQLVSKWETNWSLLRRTSQKWMIFLSLSPPLACSKYVVMVSSAGRLCRAPAKATRAEKQITNCNLKCSSVKSGHVCE